MSPSDDAFRMVVTKLDKLSDDVAELRHIVERQRGWLDAARWLGMGSLGGVAGLAAWVWATVRGH